MPLTWTECDSPALVPLPDLLGSDQPPYLATNIASPVVKEIFLDRFQKEIVEKFHFSPKSQVTHQPESECDPTDAKITRSILKERIIVGFSQCSKLLQSDDANVERPLEFIVLSSDFEPAHFAIHFPILARKLDVPLLLLPESTVELGRLLRIRSAGVLAFRARAPTTTQGVREDSIHQSIDSFVQFIKTQMQTWRVAWETLCVRCTLLSRR